MPNIENDILIKYYLGECSANETREVQEWLSLSADHQKEFDAVKKVYEACAKYSVLSHSVDIESELKKFKNTIEQLEPSQLDTSYKTYFNKSLITSFLKIAAIVVLSLSTGAFFTYIAISGKYNLKPGKEVSHQIMAPKGGKSVAILPDGTKVWLNAGTTLRYNSNYGTGSRDVELEGEAYFKVVTNPEKPFTVITSELKIKAYGTAFNVKAYPEEKLITTTLEEGKVTILGQGINVALKPNQNIKYERKTLHSVKSAPVSAPQKKETPQTAKEEVPAIPTINNIDTKVYTSWKDGRLILESEKLEDIVVILERKFDVKVNVESPELLKNKFRGTFTNETLEQILNAFRITAPITYKIEKGIVTIDLDKKRKENYL